MIAEQGVRLPALGFRLLLKGFDARPRSEAI
jgi:hypothetical protein